MSREPEPGSPGDEGEAIDPPAEFPVAFPADDIPGILSGTLTSFRRPVVRLNSSVLGYDTNRPDGRALWDHLRWDGPAFVDRGFPDPYPDGEYKYAYLHVTAWNPADGEPNPEDRRLPSYRVRCRWRPGDHLWAREAIDGRWGCDSEYLADQTRLVDAIGWDWVHVEKRYLPVRRVPAQAMPRWAARIILEVTSIGVEWAGDEGVGWDWVVNFRRITP